MKKKFIFIAATIMAAAGIAVAADLSSVADRPYIGLSTIHSARQNFLSGLTYSKTQGAQEMTGQLN